MGTLETSWVWRGEIKTRITQEEIEELYLGKDNISKRETKLNVSQWERKLEINVNIYVEINLSQVQLDLEKAQVELIKGK